MRELTRQVSALSADIHSIAHNLHSSSLEYLGFVPAVRKLAREVGKRHGIEIEIEHDGVPGALPTEISLCLFRIVQEALRNAASHSGAKRVEVHLQKDRGQIQATLSDAGKGFERGSGSDAEKAWESLMRERIRLVNGKIAIQSEPGVGTRIHAWVPLQAGL